MKTGLYSKNGKKDAKYVWEKKAGTAYLLRAGGAAGIFGLSCLLLGGCGRQTADAQKETAGGSAGETVITSAETGFTINGPGAAADGTVLTITQGGSYRVSGAVSDGRIVIDAGDGEVALIMDGLSIASADFSPIYGQQCKSLTIILEEGSENTVSDGALYEYDRNGDDEPDAAVFSHDDLIFGGDGRLRVIGNYQEGIRGKDDVTIRSGILEIEAVNDGIKGKDSVEIEGGTITVTAGGDGVQASNDSDADKGYVRITGGGLSIDAAEKGIKAETLAEITDGVLDVAAGDDAVHSNGDIRISGGRLALRSGDDGVHADRSLSVSGGELTVAESYEGLEGLSVDITGGTISIVSEDDGINAAGGADSSGNGGRGDDPFAVAEGAYIRIAGGEVRVNASGDGIDSNGDFFMEGGTLYVEGPLDGGNGILDYNGQGRIVGGTVVGTGNAGMLQTFSEDSQQPVIVRFFEAKKEGGSALKVEDSDGASLLEYAPQKEYSVLIFSSPELKLGENYRITAGEESAQAQTDEVITYSGERMGGEFPGGRGEPGRGRRPEEHGDMGRPEGAPKPPGEGGMFEGAEGGFGRRGE